MAADPYGLFEVYGVEVEYMIVDAEDLSVRPVADRLLEAVAGEPAREWRRGETAWCNELAMHVVEFNFAVPRRQLGGAAELFREDVRRANALLGAENALLLPTAMHPWMDPIGELRLWPHENEEIYRTYDAIFSCQGHGWANLQSTHINLPWSNDEEFGRLHAAIRLVLPLLPALAASSPVMDGRLTGRLDNRIFSYRDNARRIPTVTGQVVPEQVFSIDDYHLHILAPMYNDIAPFDPAAVLREDWLNSRGAIARFERQSIEIRLIDIQECPTADLGLVALVCAVVRALVEERLCSYASQREVQTEPLAQVLMRCAAEGERARIDAPELLGCLGLTGPISAAEVWERLFTVAAAGGDLIPESERFMDVYRSGGTLARRIVDALPENPDRGALTAVWRELAACLSEDRLYR